MKCTRLTLAALGFSILPLLGGIESSDSVMRSADLSGATRPAYLDSMRQRIVINSMERDPFGLPQDPDQEVIWDPPFSEEEPPTPLATLLDDMKITAINPGDRSFLVGVRWIKQGESFPLLNDDREIQVKVEAVKIGKVIFRELQGNETATISVEIAPNPRPKGDAVRRLPEGLERAPLRGAPLRLR